MAQSEPVPVVFAGFHSDTHTLGRAGWNLALEEGRDPYDPFGRRDRALMHHRDLGVTLTGIFRNADQLRNQRGRAIAPMFGRAHDFLTLSGVPHIMLHSIYRQNDMAKPRPAFDFGEGLTWRDTSPAYIEAPSCELRHLPLFAQLHPPAQEVIVDPGTVRTLMDQILRIQGTEQQDMRERDRQRARSEGAPARRVHAQIVTLAKAA